MKAAKVQEGQNLHKQHGNALKPWFARVGLGLVLVIGACVPLLIIPGLNNSIELPRAIFIRGVAALILLFLCLSPNRRELLNNGHALMIIAAVVLAASLIGATIFSVNANLSLWGEYRSQFGLLTWLAMLILCATAAIVLNTPGSQRLFARVLIGSSAIMVIYGLVRTIIQGTAIWKVDPLANVTGLLNLSDHTGGFLLMITPITVAEMLSLKRRWPFALIILGQIALLALSPVHYAWLGIIVGMFIFGLIWLYIVGRKRLACGIAVAGLVLVSLLALFFVVSDLLDGLFSMSSMDARVAIWRKAIMLIVKRPLWGYGPDAVGRAFQEMYPVSLVAHLGFQPALARAGNLWLDIGLGTGLIGLAAYIFLLACAVRLIWRRLVRGEDVQRRFLLAGMASALVGHVLALQLGTESIATAALFWLLLGASVSDTARSVKHSWQSQTRSWKYLPLFAAALILLGMVTIPPLLADRAFWQGHGLDPASNKAFERYVEATQQWPIEPFYHLALAEAYWAAGQPAAAASELVSTAEQNPENAEIWAAVGDLYLRWGALDPSRFSLSIAAYRRAVELSPDTAAYHVALGQALAENGRLDDAAQEFERALAINPYDEQTKTVLDQISEPAAQTEAGE